MRGVQERRDLFYRLRQQQLIKLREHDLMSLSGPKSAYAQLYYHRIPHPDFYWSYLAYRPGVTSKMAMTYFDQTNGGIFYLEDFGQPGTAKKSKANQNMRSHHDLIVWNFFLRGQVEAPKQDVPMRRDLKAYPPELIEDAVQKLQTWPTIYPVGKRRFKVDDKQTSWRLLSLSEDGGSDRYFKYPILNAKRSFPPEDLIEASEREEREREASECEAREAQESENCRPSLAQQAPASRDALVEQRAKAKNYPSFYQKIWELETRENEVVQEPWEGAGREVLRREGKEAFCVFDLMLSDLHSSFRVHAYEQLRHDAAKTPFYRARQQLYTYHTRLVRAQSKLLPWFWEKFYEKNCEDLYASLNPSLAWTPDDAGEFEDAAHMAHVMRQLLSSLTGPLILMDEEM